MTDPNLRRGKSVRFDPEDIVRRQDAGEDVAAEIEQWSAIFGPELVQLALRDARLPSGPTLGSARVTSIEPMPPIRIERHP